AASPSAAWVARVWRSGDSALNPSGELRGALRRIHAQQPADRALARPGGLERADRYEDPRQQAPVALVHHRQPGVEHRQDQQRESEHRRSVLESTHREDDAHIHHRGAYDPGEKSECLEEAVERRETADDRERAGDLAGARVERADVDTSLRHGGTSAGESLLLYARHPHVRTPITPHAARSAAATTFRVEAMRVWAATSGMSVGIGADRVRWRPRAWRGSIEETPSQEAGACRPSRTSSRGRAAT